MGTGDGPRNIVQKINANTCFREISSMRDGEICLIYLKLNAAYIYGNEYERKLKVNRCVLIAF